MSVLNEMLKGTWFLDGKCYIRVADGITQLYFSQYSYVFLPGSFNPIHLGHVDIIECMRSIGETDVALEISPHNVDKGGIDADEIERRVIQIQKDWPSWSKCPDIYIGMAPRMTDKMKLYGKLKFAVGADTMMRVMDPEYGDVSAAVNGVTYYVAPREVNGKVIGIEQIYGIDEHPEGRYIALDTHHGSLKLSSTEERKNALPHD